MEPLELTSLQYQLSMTQLGILEWAITPEYLRQLYLMKGFPNQSILLFGMSKLCCIFYRRFQGMTCYQINYFP